MEIHELNNFTGNLDANTYVAVDDTSDTGKITYTEFVAPVKEYTDEEVADLKAEKDEEVADLNSEIKELQDGGYVADQQKIEEKIDNWLDEHPEATTTVQDGSLTEAKFADSLKLKTIKDYVTPEMFGYEDGDDLGAVVNQMLADGYYNIRLLGKEYTLKSPINVKDIVGGCIEGVCPINAAFSNVALGNEIGTSTYITAVGMNGDAGILVQGSLNFNLKNFMLRSANAGDTPSVGIYLGRTASHQSQNNCNIDGVAIYLVNNTALNGGKGTIGIYNNAAEEFRVDRTSIIASVGVVNTASDCYNLATQLGGENISGATCTVFAFDRITIGANVAFVLGHTAGITITNGFYFDKFKTEPKATILKGDFTNDVAKYWNDHYIQIYSEQIADPWYIYTDSDITIFNSHLDLYSVNATDVIHVGTGYVFMNSTFKILAASQTDTPIVDLSAVSGTVERCNFIGKPFKLYSPVMFGAFGVSNTTGMFGFAPSEHYKFPFAIGNNICIGASFGIPSDITDVANGSICLCTDPDNTVALWVFKGGTWRPINVSQ